MAQEIASTSRTRSVDLPAHTPSPHPYLRSTTLYISNVPASVSDERLVKAMAPYNPTMVRITRESPSQFYGGFMLFDKLAEAEKALAMRQGCPIPHTGVSSTLELSPYPPGHRPGAGGRPPLRPPSASPRYVLSLPLGVSDSWLYDFFRPFGALASVSIKTKLGANFGVVVFWEENEAILAEETLNGSLLDGHVLSIKACAGIVEELHSYVHHLDLDASVSISPPNLTSLPFMPISEKPCLAFGSYVRRLMLSQAQVPHLSRRRRRSLLPISQFSHFLTNKNNRSDLGAEVNVCTSNALSELNVVYTSLLEGDSLDTLTNYRRLVELAWKCIKTIPHNEFSNDEFFHHIEKDTQNLVKMVQEVLKNPELYVKLMEYRDDQAQALLDLLQDILDAHPMAEYSQTAFRKTLISLARKSGLHPRCLTVCEMELIGRHPIAGGTFADVWKGSIRSTEVAVKVLRVFQESDKTALLQEFLREALVWGQLRHPNLLPFYGLYKLSDERLCLLSPWMSFGNMLEYLHKNPSTDRMLLAHDIVHGIEFLHGERVVHGDLKGTNILISHTCRACIADFGLATFVETQSWAFNGMSSQSVRGGTARWQAPEILKVAATNTFSSDVYALGSVFYELFVGEQPFCHIKYDAGVIHLVINGVRPDRPETLNVEARLLDPVWLLMSRCWSQDPSDRPSVIEVVEFVHNCGELRCPAPQWSTSEFGEVRRNLQEIPLCPSLENIKRLLR